MTLPERKGRYSEKPPTRKEQYSKCTMDINGMLLPQQKRYVSSAVGKSSLQPQLSHCSDLVNKVTDRVTCNSASRVYLCPTQQDVSPSSPRCSGSITYEFRRKMNDAGRAYRKLGNWINPHLPIFYPQVSNQSFMREADLTRWLPRDIFIHLVSLVVRKEL